MSGPTLDDRVLAAIRLGTATRLSSLCCLLGLGTAGAGQVEASLDRLLVRGLIVERARR